MTKKIYIYNPKDIPFGPLSLIYPVDNFEINGQKYVNLTNYIYNFLGCTTMDRNVLANMKKQQDISKTAFKMNLECAEEISYDSLRRAFVERFKSAKFSSALLSTGNKELIYDSPDSFEGIGSDGRGLNKIGKLLMSIRSFIRERETIRQSDYASFIKNLPDYQIYTVYNFLTRLITRGISDLSEFEGLTPIEIIQKVGKNVILNENISLDEYNRLYRDNKPESVKKIEKNLNSIVSEVRQSNIDIFIEKRLLTNLDKLIEIYFMKKGLTKGRGITISEVIKTMRQNREKFSGLTDKLIDLYLKGGLQSEIVVEFNRIAGIPSREEVEKIREKEILTVLKTDEGYKVISEGDKGVEDIPPVLLSDIPEIVEEIIESQEQISKEEVKKLKEEDQKIFFGNRDNREYGFLAPDFIDMIVINGLYYPSPFHYKIARLFDISRSYSNEKINIASLKEDKYSRESHDMLMKDPSGSPLDINNYILESNELFSQYERINAQLFSEALEDRTLKALRKKFSLLGYEFIQLLVNTGEAELIYNDFEDHILGGHEGGANLAGKMLMKLREESKAAGYVVKELEARDVKMIEVAKNNIDFVRWGLMRTDDLIESLKTTISYISNNPYVNQQVKLTPEFIEFVINKLYDHCFEILLNPDTITNVPIDFYKKVKYDLSKYYIGPKGITVIWQYIYSLMTQAIDVLGEGDVTRAIQELSDIPSIQIKELSCEGVFDDEIQNCTLLAIKNIISIMGKYIDDKYKNFVISEDDINYAINMLVDIPQTEIPSGASLVDESDIKVKIGKDKEQIVVKRKVPVLDDDGNPVLDDEGRPEYKIIEIKPVEKKGISLDVKKSKFSIQEQAVLIKEINKLPDDWMKMFEEWDANKILNTTFSVMKAVYKITGDPTLEKMIKTYKKEVVPDFDQEKYAEIYEYLKDTIAFTKDIEYLKGQRINYITSYFKDFFETSYLTLEVKNNILRKVLWFMNWIKNYSENENNKKRLVSRLNMFIHSNTGSIKKGLKVDIGKRLKGGRVIKKNK